MRCFHAFLVMSAFAMAGCGKPHANGNQPILASVSSPPPRAPSDIEQTSCRARIAELAKSAALPGAPAFETNRLEILGRARGEPMLFVREPRETVIEPSSKAIERALKSYQTGLPGGRVVKLARELHGDPKTLRSILLRDGYLYSSDPHDALELSLLHLRDLFDEQEIFVHRGFLVRSAIRKDRRDGRVYVWSSGENVGKDADLLFGDRVSIDQNDFAEPLHRDIRDAAANFGFDRAKIVALHEHAIVADLRFDGTFVRSVLKSEGASLELDCREAPDSQITTLNAFASRNAPRRRSMNRLQKAVSSAVDESLRFDRPEGEKTAERDGLLRPLWWAAFSRGGSAFDFEGHSYPTRDPMGRAWPPEVCIDFVIDSYERAAGSWYLASSQPQGPLHREIDFDPHGTENLRGVIGFLKFAERTPALFDVRHFQGEERIQFEHRTAFFEFLRDHADEFRAGDVLAIQGRKRDGLIHQHAILLEATDPLTGFPYGLADQMKRPRRRTWEGIMAEAPARSLLFRARPTDAVLLAGERVAILEP